MKPMTGKEILTSIIPLLAPVLTAAMGALGIVMKDRRNARNLDQQLRSQVEIGQAEVQFIHAWIQARQLLGPLGDDSCSAQEWLDRCYTSVEDSQNKVALAPQKQLPVLRRLLLLRPLQGASAQVWRAIYWLTFLCCNLFVFWMTAGIVEWIRGVPDASSLVFGEAAFAVISGVLATIPRAIAMERDRVARNPVEQPRQPSGNVAVWSPRKKKQSQSWGTPHDDS